MTCADVAICQPRNLQFKGRFSYHNFPLVHPPPGKSFALSIRMLPTAVCAARAEDGLRPPLRTGCRPVGGCLVPSEGQPSGPAKRAEEAIAVRGEEDIDEQSATR